MTRNAPRAARVGEAVVVRPERFVAGGDAMGRLDDGRIVFVRGAIPGETVAVRLVTGKRDWARAEAQRVDQQSPDRIDVACEHRVAGCGGCDWMHVEPTAQLSWKARIVTDALVRTGKIADPLVEPRSSVGSRGYRTTLRAVAGADGRLGLRSTRSHRVVATPRCLVAHPGLVDLLATARASAGLDVTLRVSAATGERTARWNPRQGTVRGLPADVGFGADAAVHERVHDAMLRVSAGSFFQSGPEAAELLVDAVRDVAPELARASTVVDAYAGVGVFGRCAVGHDARVVAIESSRAAVADARRNLAGRDVQIEATEVGDADVPGDVDVVIADPPRSGLGRAGATALARMSAPVMVLVSCDPVSLARDAGLLARCGYQLEQTAVLDLFPHTHHVETVSRLTRRGSAGTDGGT